MNNREITEKLESNLLCEYACLSCKTKGRKIQEKLCDIRTEFQRDRDRILHSKAFRRLKHKTQVFISPIGDHYRTRLTHTLEVSQIARTVAKALKLNEDLVEAISLGHDLGHTPFGHAGETALNNIFKEKFRHYEQSVRVLERLEKNGQGLNLTFEVLDGILHHTCGELPSTVEGQLVRICDKIAYINHDIEDASIAKILDINSLPKNFTNILEESVSSRINAMVIALIKNSFNGVISMGDKMKTAFNEVHKFMYDNVYLNKKSVSEEEKVPFVIESIYKYFMNNINKLPDYLIQIAKNESPERAVCDYIAGMTDQFAINLFTNIFLPSSSKIF